MDNSDNIKTIVTCLNNQLMYLTNFYNATETFLGTPLTANAIKDSESYSNLIKNRESSLEAYNNILNKAKSIEGYNGIMENKPLEVEIAFNKLLAIWDKIVIIDDLLTAKRLQINANLQSSLKQVNNKIKYNKLMSSGMMHPGSKFNKTQ